MKQKKNSENLTFDDWLGTATMGSCFLTVVHYQQYAKKHRVKFKCNAFQLEIYTKEIMRRVRICRERWANGDDPTETYYANQFPFGDISEQFK